MKNLEDIERPIELRDEIAYLRRHGFGVGDLCLVVIRLCELVQWNANRIKALEEKLSPKPVPQRLPPIDD